MKVFFKAVPKLLRVLMLLLGSGFSMLHTQNREASLYSAYGLGLKSSISAGAHITAMGGGGVAYHHPRDININNPASFASLSYVNYEAGLALDYREFFTEEGFGARTAGYLNQLAFAFPYKSLFTIVFGLKPLYRVGYEITTGTSDKPYIYYGSGDISKAYFSLASAWGKLRLGLSASYVFGDITKAVLYSSSQTQYSLQKEQSSSIQAGGYRLGVQYDLFQFNDGQSTLGLGLTFAGTYAGNYSGQEQLKALSTTSIRSSLSLDQISHRPISLPMEAAIGLLYRIKGLWSVVGDYRFSNTHIIKDIGLLEAGKNYSYTDDHRFSLGAGYTPELTNYYGSYYQTISYRLGGYFEKIPLVIDGATLYGYGVTIGTTLPVFSKLSMANIHFAYSFGILESTDKSLPREYTYSFLLNLSFFDTWFAEYKYD